MSEGVASTWAGRLLPGPPSVPRPGCIKAH